LDPNTVTSLAPSAGGFLASAGIVPKKAWLPSTGITVRTG
jgi:hypothetical protein